MNLVSCHIFKEKPNLTVISHCRYFLLNNYLAENFLLFQKTLNSVKLRIHAIEKLETDFVMAKNTSISSVANNIKKFHIQSNLNFIYKQKFYHDKQYEMDTLCDEYSITLLIDINHPTLIEEWKRNIDDATYEK